MTELEDVVRRSQRLSETTKELYASKVAEFVEFAGSHPGDWTAYNLERWRDHLRDVQGLKASSVNLYLSAIKFASKRRCALRGQVDFASAAEMLRVPATTKKKKALTEGQMRRLLATCSENTPWDIRDRAIFLIMLHAGFRRNEMLTMAFENCRAQNITVIAKGDKAHTVKVGQQAWAAFDLWRNWVSRFGSRTGPVFRSIHHYSLREEIILGDALSGSGFSKIIRTRGEQAGIKNLHPHMLRHTCTSLLLKNGVPPWRVQLILGHKSPITTAHYTDDVSGDAVGDFLPDL